ncbi:MAG: LptF/LptG family permease [Gemmatimonadales bacterium]|nr:LptF/LptG family permease [Gemmatimonadales bacterium]
MKPGGLIDRYVLRQWLGIFLLSAAGIPAVSVLIRLSENFGKMADKEVPSRDILVGTLLLYPGQMAMLFPAGVLFATIFTLNALGRHNELTAIKAGGVSFYRLITPMLVLAALAVPANFALQELAAVSTARQLELHREKPSPDDQVRFNFAFQNHAGWTLAVRELQRGSGRIRTVLASSPVDSLGARWLVAADSARWDSVSGSWIFMKGASHLMAERDTVTTMTFSAMKLDAVTESPTALMDSWIRPEEMRTHELRDHLERLRRSGVRPGQMAVDYPLRYAIPVACLVVALFGAPLAVTSPRAGAALGLAMALGTTLTYLTGTQIMKAVGGKDIITPLAAAWSMNAVFLALAVVLLARARS